MSFTKTPQFKDSQAALDRSNHYISVEIKIPLVLDSWKKSLFAHEWFLPNGQLKTVPELSEGKQERCRDVIKKIEAGEAVQKPILGVGLLDNVEIGSGGAVFMLLATEGYETIPVHIPKSNQKDFKKFIV